MCPIHVCTMEHVLGWITTHSNVFARGAGKENVAMVSKDFKTTRFYLFQYTYIFISSIETSLLIVWVRSKRSFLQWLRWTMWDEASGSHVKLYFVEERRAGNVKWKVQSKMAIHTNGKRVWYELMFFHMSMFQKETFVFPTHAKTKVTVNHLDSPSNATAQWVTKEHTAKVNIFLKSLKAEKDIL